MKSLTFDWNSIPVTPTQVGTVRKIFQMPTTLLQEIEYHVTTLNPGMSPHPPHHHRHEEMIIVKEGMLDARVENEIARLNVGDILFVASNELHGWTNVGDEPATYYVIQWNVAQ